MGADLQVHGGRADDAPRFGVLGHEQQAVVGVDQPGKQRVVVVAGVRVIGPVGCQEDLTDRANVSAGRFSYGDHVGSLDGETGARSRRTSRAQRSTICGISTCSWAAWAPSPTAPRPSRVAVYWLVVLPSEAPPTAA